MIAVVDSGIDMTHPDLAAKVRTDIDEDFVNQDDDPTDDNGHGTHVAGIAAAVTNNAEGVAGMCPDCMIVPYKVLDDRGGSFDPNIAAAIRKATDDGAKVINLSIAKSAPMDVEVQAALQYAVSQGALPICAAGDNNSSDPVYPAYWPECVAVAATDANDNKAGFSSYGSWVDTSAPGVDIYSTAMGGTYASMEGTSMAAPHVAGLAGLLFSQGRSLDDVRARLTTEKYTDSINSTSIPQRINAHKALELPAPACVNVQDVTETSARVTWCAVEGATEYHVWLGGQQVAKATSPETTLGSLTAGTSYTVSVTAQDPYVSDGTPASTAFTTPLPPLLAAPTCLSTDNITETSARVTWCAVAGATSYHVKLGDQPVVTTTTLEAPFSGLAAGTSYTVTVTAVDQYGRDGAAGSTTFTTALSSLLAAPPCLSAGNVTDTSARITWCAVAGATSYHVKLGDQLIATTTDLTATLSGLTANTQYTVTVTAVDQYGRDGAPASITFTTALPPLLAAPTCLSASNVTDTSARLTWCAVSGATTYHVRRGSQLVATTTSLQATLSGLTASTSYTASVTAVDQYGRDGSAASITFKTTAPPTIGAPTLSFSPSACPRGANCIPECKPGTFSWTGVAGATGYSLYLPGGSRQSVTGTSTSGCWSDGSYRVTAIVGSSEGPASNTVRITVTGGGGDPTM